MTLFTIVGGAFSQQALPYEYGFENNDLATEGWTKVFTANEPVISSNAKRTGDYGFRFSSYDKAASYDQYLITKELSAPTGVDVEFYYNTYGTGSETFKVGYSTTDNDIASFTFGDEIVASGTTWKRFEESYPAGTKYIAIYYYSNYNYYLYVDDFSFTAANPYGKPTDLTMTDITTNAATISWTAPSGSVKGYTYQYKKNSEDAWSAETNINTTSATLSGLASGTTYNFRVKAIHASGESDFATINFVTDCDVVSLPYSEGFEGEVNCWTKVDCESGTTIVTGMPHTGDRSFAFVYNSTPPQYLISPEFDGATAIEVSFYYKNYKSSYVETFQVGYSTTTKETSAFTWDTELEAADTEWTLYENIFPVGTKYIAIKYNSNDKWYLFLDDFNFEATSGVVKPTDLSADLVGTTTADVSWEGTHDSYVLQYRTAAQAMKMSAWHQVGDDIAPTNKLTTYVFDLSGFTGTGDIAIRHYNVTDMFNVNIDDIVVTNAGSSVVFSEDFESGSIPGTWSNIDLDGDGYKWSIRHTTDNDKYGQPCLNGEYCATSASWVDGVGAINPDNWLIIPNVELGGTLTLVARGQDPDYPADNFGVFVAQESYDPVAAGAWSSDIETTAKTYKFTGLTANTPYDWQVKGVVGVNESNWATATFTTIPEGFRTFIADGNWNDAANWFPSGVPSASDEVAIQADATIPSGVTALAKRATISGGSITISDGGQLKQGAPSLKVTMEKGITAGKNTFIASPFNGRTEVGYSSTWSHVINADDGDYDFYAFDSTQPQEWINYKTQTGGTGDNNFFYSGILWGEGYMYSNDAATTLGFTGTTWSSSNNSMTKAITYDGSATDEFNGWRLIGNPYTCTGYVYYVDDSDNLLDAFFLKMNAAGDGYDLYENAVELAPGEGAFMLIGESGNIKYSSEDLGVAINKIGTENVPYLPVHGLAINQGAGGLILANNDANNATTIAAYDGLTRRVTLSGRTLYQDDSWNTMTLPFDLTVAGSPLDGATVKVLSTATEFDSNTLNVSFEDAPATIPAGTPFIVKWASGSNITDPVFTGVTINNTTPSVAFSGGSFVGNYSPVTLNANDYTKLYLGAANKLYWPAADVTVNSFRAYFNLPGATAAPGITLDFGDGGITAIENVKSETTTDGNWYTVDGRKLDNKPTIKGVYVNNGRKVVIK